MALFILPAALTLAALLMAAAIGRWAARGSHATGSTTVVPRRSDRAAPGHSAAGGVSDDAEVALRRDSDAGVGEAGRAESPAERATG
jgi:hypothetical protein